MRRLLGFCRRQLFQLAGAWNRIVFIARIRGQALAQNAHVELDIAHDIRLGKRIVLEISHGSRTRLTIKRNCKIGDGVTIRLRGGEIWLGETVDVRGGAVLSAGGGCIRLDGPNNISWGVVIHCAESVHLERFAHVAEYSTLVDSSHFYTTPDVWSYHNVKTAPVHLGQDVWVCPKSTIASGVEIGDHTIVAANSCVIKSAPSGVLLSGVPARIVRELDLPWRRDPSDCSAK